MRELRLRLRLRPLLRLAFPPRRRHRGRLLGALLPLARGWPARLLLTSLARARPWRGLLRGRRLLLHYRGGLTPSRYRPGRSRYGVSVPHLDDDLLVPQLPLQLRLAELPREHQPPLLPLQLGTVLDAARRVRRAQQVPPHAHRRAHAAQLVVRRPVLRQRAGAEAALVIRLPLDLSYDPVVTRVVGREALGAHDGHHQRVERLRQRLGQQRNCIRRAHRHAQPARQRRGRLGQRQRVGSLA